MSRENYISHWIRGFIGSKIDFIVGFFVFFVDCALCDDVWMSTD